VRYYFNPFALKRLATTVSLPLIRYFTAVCISWLGFCLCLFLITHQEGISLYWLSYSRQSFWVCSSSSILLDGPGTSPIPVDYLTEGETQFYFRNGPEDFLDTGAITASIATDIPGFGNQGSDNEEISGIRNQSFQINNGIVYLTPGAEYRITLSASAVVAAGTLDASNPGEVYVTSHVPCIHSPCCSLALTVLT